MVKLFRPFIIVLILMIPLFGYSQPKVGKKFENRKATFYHNKFVNRRTSSGEKFVQTKYTAAHKTIPLNTLVKVTNQNNGRSVIVKVNDRCPKRGVIDLSLVAAKRLKMIEKGVASVEIEILSDDYLDIWQKQDEIFNMFDRIEEKDSLNTSCFDSSIIGNSMRFLGCFSNLKPIQISKLEMQVKQSWTNIELSSKYAGNIRVLPYDKKQYSCENIGYFNPLNSFNNVVI